MTIASYSHPDNLCKIRDCEKVFVLEQNQSIHHEGHREHEVLILVFSVFSVSFVVKKPFSLIWIILSQSRTLQDLTI